MAFSGDHPVVENILFDVSGSAVALVHSATIGPDLLSQPGLMVAGYHSSSTGGYQAALFQLDDAGRLLVNAGAGAVTTVTGSVVVQNQVTVTTTGSLPVVVTAPVAIAGAVNAIVSGTVGLDRGDSFANPLYMTGAIGLDIGGSPADPLYVTGSVGVSGPISITGPVTVTGSVGLDRGNSFANPLFTTGSVGVNGLVHTQEVIATQASGTYVLANTSAVTILAANPNRRGALIYNLSNKAMYVKFGTGCAPLDFTVKVFSDDVYNVPVLYTGIVTACWATGPNLGAMVTETTP